jgi:hypothetical protein
MPPRLSDMSADLDALYRAPLPEFITQRNTLAARLRGEQGKEAAAAVKALAKPGGTAWVVNQLYWRHGREFDALMKTGDRLRDVQQQRLAGEDEADMHAAAGARQAALSVLMARVPELLAEAGLSASQDMRTRVSTTLEALSIYGGREPGPRVGRLIEDVDPPGFAALALLVPAVPESRGPATAGKPSKGASGDAGASGAAGASSSLSAASSASRAGAAGKAAATPHAAPKLRAIDTKRVNEAKAALNRAEEEAAEARTAAKTADAARQKAETKWQDAKAALDEAQRLLDAAMDRERVAEQARDAARKAATTARQALDKAERTRDQAERAYQGTLGR